MYAELGLLGEAAYILALVVFWEIIEKSAQ